MYWNYLNVNTYRSDTWCTLSYVLILYDKYTYRILPRHVYLYVVKMNWDWLPGIMIWASGCLYSQLEWLIARLISRLVGLWVVPLIRLSLFLGLQLAISTITRIIHIAIARYELFSSSDVWSSFHLLISCLIFSLFITYNLCEIKIGGLLCPPTLNVF